ncbi:hypothetical protein NPIL_474061 [Nephila pilipes]|uniref:Uncharacterized protein n=1 Tax=Nephila pilipes TaxID=299642 RepID=A0A8X6TMV2_NEPPI|nr:hypothetical protein NPIL_474061 [Nephila pilipes]
MSRVPISTLSEIAPRRRSGFPSRIAIHRRRKTFPKQTPFPPLQKGGEGDHPSRILRKPKRSHVRFLKPLSQLQPLQATLSVPSTPYNSDEPIADCQLLYNVFVHSPLLPSSPPFATSTSNPFCSPPGLRKEGVEEEGTKREKIRERVRCKKGERSCRLGKREAGKGVGGKKIDEFWFGTRDGLHI